MKGFLFFLLVAALAAGCGGDDSGVETGSNVTSNNSSTSPNGLTGNNSVTDAGVDTSLDAGSANNASTDAGQTSREDAANPQDMAMPEPYGDPGLAGTFATTTRSETAMLAGENVSMTIFTPTGAGPFPVVVFHHGFQLSPSLYTSYGEQLASWGYVAVLPDMPGGFFGPTHVELKDIVVALLDWLGDEAQAGNVPADTTNVGLAGHSLGGKISLLTATEDERVKAVVAIDPVDSAPPGTFDTTNYPSVTPELMPSITATLAIIGETIDSSGGFQACAPGDENFQKYYDAATSPAFVLNVLDANHMSFLDNPNCGTVCSFCNPSMDDPAVTRELTRRVMTATFELVLKGENRARPYLTGEPADAAVSGLATYETKGGF